MEETGPPSSLLPYAELFVPSGAFLPYKVQTPTPACLTPDPDLYTGTSLLKGLRPVLSTSPHPTPSSPSASI